MSSKILLYLIILLPFAIMCVIELGILKNVSMKKNNRIYILIASIGLPAIFIVEALVRGGWSLVVVWMWAPIVSFLLFTLGYSLAKSYDAITKK